MRYPAAIAAAPALELDDYMSWMLPCSAISILDLPALSLPVGLELQVTIYKLQFTSYKLQGACPALSPPTATRR